MESRFFIHMDPFQNNGDWWVPSTSEKVSGEVSFSPTEGVVLKLNGSLPSEAEEPEQISRAELAKDYSLLHGDLGQDGPVTLLDATITSANFGGHSEAEEYLAQRMLIGEHLPSNPSFERADFVVDEIPVWTNSSTVRPVIDTQEVEQVVEFDDIEAVYAATSSKVYTADLDELEVKLSNYSRTSFGIDSAEMETIGVLKILPSDEATLSTLYEYGNDVLEYLSFAIGTGIYPDKVQLYTDLDEQPLDAYHTLVDYTGERSASKAEYLFRPDHTDFETTLQDWVEHCEEVPEMHQNYRLLLHRSNLSPRLQFLTTVIALEAFYDSKYQSETLIPEEEFDEIQSDILQLIPEDPDLQNQIYGLLENVANTPSIKDKLIKLMESEQELIEVFFDISELASEARTERNAVAHGSSEATPIRHNILSRELQLILEALIAREIGVPADDLPNALASRHQGLMEQMNLSEDNRDS